MTTAAVITKYDEAVTNEPPSPPTQDTFARETSSENPPTYNDGTSDDRPAKLTLGQRFHKISSKVGQPLNKAANGIGAEDLDIARPPTKNGPVHPTGLTRKSMVKIPPKVLENCAGLAIFNTFRAGAWHGSLSGGSGVVIARRSDGTWSPPSSFIISSLGGGFIFGLDLYDCVCVLNTAAQVDAFTRPRFALGAGVNVALGPVGAGAAVNAAVSKTGRPIWSYSKSRGLWAGLQVDGTVMVTRGDANALFYNERGITAKKILTGDVAWPEGARPLFEVLKALEGRKDVDQDLVDEVRSAPPPGDNVVDESGNIPPPPPAYEESAHGDEKQHPTSEATEVRDDDLYANSAADEKERLAKSGF